MNIPSRSLGSSAVLLRLSRRAKCRRSFSGSFEPKSRRPGIGPRMGATQRRCEILLSGCAYPCGRRNKRWQASKLSRPLRENPSCDRSRRRAWWNRGGAGSYAVTRSHTIPANLVLFFNFTELLALGYCK